MRRSAFTIGLVCVFGLFVAWPLWAQVYDPPYMDPNNPFGSIELDDGTIIDFHKQGETLPNLATPPLFPEGSPPVPASGAAVPEPASVIYWAGLAGIGAVAFLLRRLRRK